MRTEFKSIAQFYVGSKFITMKGEILPIDGYYSDTVFYTDGNQFQYFGCSMVKPILYPLSAMTEDFRNKLGLLAKEQADDPNTPFAEAMALATKLYCDYHYNVFGLEADQFIDPSSLPIDPYKQ